MITSITDYIMSKTSMLNIVPETSPKKSYSQFNTGSVEVEIAEFLYGLVRSLKPEYIVETGTHKGISALYMALALEQNQKGKLTTFEIIPPHFEDAKKLFRDLKIQHRIDARLANSLHTTSSAPIDLLFLDSEPQYRFDEFLLYWDWIRPGGYIAIHDLPHNLGHSDSVVNGTYDWPYGDFRKKLSPFIRNHQVQTMNLPTIRGFSFFQKEAPAYAWTKHLRGEL